MRALRVIAGLACIAAALALTGALLLRGPAASASSSPALMAHLPPVVFGLALLALGLWLLLGRR